MFFVEYLENCPRYAAAAVWTKMISKNVSDFVISDCRKSLKTSEFKMLSKKKKNNRRGRVKYEYIVTTNVSIPIYETVTR